MIGPRVKRRVALSKLAANGQHAIRTSRWFFWTVGQTPEGIGDLEISFPGFNERDSRLPAPGTPEHQPWIDIFAAELAYNGRPIRVGSSISDETSHNHLIEVQVRGIMGDPGRQIMENILFAHSVGVTRDCGHCVLIYELSGRIEARSNAKRISWR